MHSTEGRSALLGRGGDQVISRASAGEHIYPSCPPSPWSSPPVPHLQRTGEPLMLRFESEQAAWFHLPSANETALALDVLEDVKPGSRVVGITPAEAVDVVAV